MGLHRATERTSSSAISALERPRATSSRTSSSRAVRSSRTARPRCPDGGARRMRRRAAASRSGRAATRPGATALDGIDELVRRSVLEQEAARAGAQRLVDVLVEVERREHSTFAGSRRRARYAASPRCRPARHADVHQDDVRLRRSAQLDGLRAVGGLARPPRGRARTRGSAGSPPRTSAWSSARSTRITAAAAAAWRGRRSRRPGPRRLRARRHRPAPARACRPGRARRRPRGAVGAAAVVADASSSASRPSVERTSAAAPGRVLAHVRERLLHDPVGREVEARRAALAARRPDSQLDRQRRRRAPARRARRAAPSAGLRCELLPSSLLRSTPSSRRISASASPARRPDRLQRRARERRLAVEHGPAASAWTTITLTPWATTSWSSRAIRARSSTTAFRGRSARARAAA